MIPIIKDRGCVPKISLRLLYYPYFNGVSVMSISVLVRHRPRVVKENESEGGKVSG